MKAYKGTITRYWKYQAWTQPILLANGTIGGTSFACSASHEGVPAWAAFNGDNTTGDNAWWSNHGATSESNPCWIAWYNPTPLKISQIVIQNEVHTPANFKTGYLQYSDNYIDWTTLQQVNGTNTAAYETIVNVNSSVSAHRYWRLYFVESFSSSGLAIQTIENYAQQLVAGTPTDYDFTTTETGTFGVKQNNNYYLLRSV